MWLFKLISDHRRPRQYTTTAIYDMSPQLRLQCAQGRDFINTYAGTGVCVHTPIRLNPLASLAWLGKQAPCPLQKVEVFYLLRLHTLTRTRTRARVLARANIAKDPFAMHLESFKRSKDLKIPPADVFHHWRNFRWRKRIL
jgi:hypothetical protein